MSRETLIELIKRNPYAKTTDSITDHLIANGVIIPVRCKDCKHWVVSDDVGYCDNPDGLDNYARPNDFCSYGKLKT